MKALVKSAPGRGLTLTDVPLPTIGDRDVLIKVDRTGICGTDLHIYNWDAWAEKTIPTPLVIGHEFVGSIAEIGSAVEFFKLDDIVSGEAISFVACAGTASLADVTSVRTPPESASPHQEPSPNSSRSPPLTSGSMPKGSHSMSPLSLTLSEMPPTPR